MESYILLPSGYFRIIGWIWQNPSIPNWYWVVAKWWENNSNELLDSISISQFKYICFLVIVSTQRVSQIRCHSLSSISSLKKTWIHGWMRCIWTTQDCGRSQCGGKSLSLMAVFSPHYSTCLMPQASKLGGPVPLPIIPPLPPMSSYCPQADCPAISKQMYLYDPKNHFQHPNSFWQSLMIKENDATCWAWPFINQYKVLSKRGSSQPQSSLNHVVCKSPWRLCSSVTIVIASGDHGHHHHDHHHHHLWSLWLAAFPVALVVASGDSRCHQMMSTSQWARDANGDVHEDDFCFDDW